MLGQFTGEEQPDGGLDFPGGDGGTLVVVSKTGGFGSDALEDVVDKGVHDGHSLGADTSVGVDLLQDLVDVDGIALLPGLSAFLATFGCSLGDGLLGALLGRRLRCGVRHCQQCIQQTVDGKKWRADPIYRRHHANS